MKLFFTAVFLFIVTSCGSSQKSQMRNGILKVVRSGEQSFSKCVDKESSVEKYKADVKWTIDDLGSVKNVEVVKLSPADLEVKKCLAGEVAKLRFDNFIGKDITVQLAVAFGS